MEIVGNLIKQRLKQVFCDYIHEYDPKYDVFKIVEIKKQQYIYFSYINNCGGTACDGFSYITFSLLNIELERLLTSFIVENTKGNLKIIFLKYCMENIQTFEELKSETPFLTKWLVNASTNSKRIYKPTKDDFDLDAPRNFSKKWEVDNQAAI